MGCSLLCKGVTWKHCFVILVAVSALFLFGNQTSKAAEAGYPSRPIEMTIGYAPGAGTDLGTRIIAEKAKQVLGQDIVCENKPGGGGRTALTLVSKAKPDGYTLAATTDSAIILSPNIEKVPYKATEDFTYITRFGILDFGNIVMADSPFKKWQDVIDFAKANPDKLTISTVGEGTVNDVAFKAMMRLYGLKLKLVPFNGAAPAVTALLGGHVMMASTATSGYANYVRTKMIRILSLMGDERDPRFPDVPTWKDLGYPMTFQSWYVISGPKGMDPAIVKKLSDAFGKALQAPEYIKLAKELEIYSPKPLYGDELRKGILQRNEINAALFTKLRMEAK